MNSQSELKKLVNLINKRLEQKITITEIEDNETFTVKLIYPKDSFQVTVAHDMKEILNKKQLFALRQDTYLMLLLDIVEAYTNLIIKK